MTSPRMLTYTLLVLLCAVSGAFALELSSDMVFQEDGETLTGKVHIKGDKFRVEMQGQSGYTILRQDKNLMWVVVPEEQSYIEMPLDPERAPRVEGTLKGEVARRRVGEETVEGHPCEKYEVTVEERGTTVTVYQWVAKDLDGFPIKTAATDGSWSATYTNIKTSVSDHHFEVPPDYVKMSLPAMPEMER